MDRGIELLAHALTAIARRPDFTTERAELHVAVVLDQYMQGAGLSEGDKGPEDPVRRPAEIRAATYF